MKKTVRTPTIVLILASLVFLSLPSDASGTLSQDVSDGSTLPQSRRIESERLFFRAYDFFVSRKYGLSSAELDRALQANTYLVDYYLLKSMLFRRTGRYQESEKALGYYLEVRPGDESSRRFFSQIQKERDFLRRFFAFSTQSLPPQVSERPTASFLSFGLLDRPGAVGLGKVGCLGEKIVVCDTLGDTVLVFNGSGDLRTRIPAPHPVASLPMQKDSIRILCGNGTIVDVLLSDGSGKTTTRGKLVGTLSDGVPLDSGRALVANVENRRIEEIDLETMKILSSWKPDNLSKPFEPVALSLFGSWLATGDRNNGVITLLDASRGFRPFCSLPFPKVRDLCWSSWGELFAISDDGIMAKIAFSPSEKAMIRTDIASDFSDGWSLCEIDDAIVCFDVRMFRSWRMEYGGMSPFSGFLSLWDPILTRDGDSPALSLKATTTFPMFRAMSGNSPIAQVVWGDKGLPAKVSDLPSSVPASLPFFFSNDTRSAGAAHSAGTRVRSGEGICGYLEKAWNPERERYESILVDSTIPFRPEDRERLTGFCLMNSISVFIYAASIPDPSMVRLATLTGGGVVYHLPEAPLPRSSNAPRTVALKIPIPSDMTTSGYPGRSMLSVFLDLGIYHQRDWLPLWGNRIPAR